MSVCPICKGRGACDECAGGRSKLAYEYTQLRCLAEIEQERTDQLAERIRDALEGPYESPKLRADRLARACAQVVQDLRSGE